MSANENRRQIQELRWIGFQRLLAGIVIIFAVGILCFIFLDEGTDLHPHSYSSGRGMGMLLLLPAYGLWNIARGIIYLIRSQSGNENYAKGVEGAMDKNERKLEERMGQKMANGSMHNVFVLLVCVFLFLAVVGAIGIGYLFWTRPT